MFFGARNTYIYHSCKFCCFALILWFGHAVQGKELVLVAGWEKPPYVISAQNSGFEIELMAQVLGQLNYSISVLYVPYGRTYEIFKREQADIGLTLSPKLGVPENLLSLPYVTYQNVAISLNKNTIKLDKLSELKNLSVIAFQSASKVLGPGFATAVNSNPFYLELPDQRRQVELLLIGSVDVVVMDINIFNYFGQLIEGENQMAHVKVHNFFAPTHYSAAIKDPQLLSEFNLALTRFITSERYRELVAKYQLFYPATRTSSE